MQALKLENTNTRKLDQPWHQKNRSALLLKRKIAKQFKLAGDDVTADKLYRCCETESLVCCQDCGGYWWVKYRCKLRCCPICSREKSRDRATYLKAIAAHQNNCKMITLTMRRWKQDPREGIKYLRQSVQRFRDLTIMKSCKGGAYTIEVLPKDDGWHIHCHLIVEVNYIPVKILWKAWAKCVHQDFAHARIQGASSDKIKAYICKYASKSAIKEIGLSSIVDWFEAVKGSRLWATFGAWYNAKLEDLVDPDTPEKPPFECPFCHAVHSVFHARAGPFIIGEGWQDWMHGLLLQDVFERPNEEVQNYLDYEQTTESMK